MIFVDPDGMEATKVIITGEQAKEATKQLDQSTSLTLERNKETGEISAKGEAVTEADKKLLEAINSPTITVNLETTDKGGTQVTGVFNGNKKNADGTVDAYQLVDPTNTKIVDNVAERAAGVTVEHEVLEAYASALVTKENPKINMVNGENSMNPDDKAFNYAHNEAERIDKRHTANYSETRTKKGIELKNINNGKKAILPNIY